MPGCSSQTAYRSSKSSPCGSSQSTARRSKQAKQRAVKLRTAYLPVADNGDVADVSGLLKQTVGDTPFDAMITRPRVDDNFDVDVEACQLYQWTQNLSVED